MKKILKPIVLFLDDTIFRFIVKLSWPQYKRQRKGHIRHFRVLLLYFIPQKILRINGDVPWPVDFRSRVTGWENIKKGIMCDPGDNPGLYINAGGGLKLGNNVAIAANTSITTTNHDMYDHSKTAKTKGVSIGDNVWIGANCSIVAGVTIGDNVTIGPGCVIRKNIPSNSIVVHQKENLRILKKRAYKWDVKKEKLL